MRHKASDINTHRIKITSVIIFHLLVKNATVYSPMK